MIRVDPKYKALMDSWTRNPQVRAWQGPRVHGVWFFSLPNQLTDD